MKLVMHAFFCQTILLQICRCSLKNWSFNGHGMLSKIQFELFCSIIEIKPSGTLSYLEKLSTIGTEITATKLKLIHSLR